MFEIRADRGKPQGAKKLVAERAMLRELLGRGYSLRESARIIGVNYRTVKRWRAGDITWGHKKWSGRTTTNSSLWSYQPLLSSRYLSLKERMVIADALLAGESVRSIARTLDRSPSTISREIQRNRDGEGGAYRPHAAQDLADARRARPKAGKILRNPELRSFIQRHLNLRWSPEQIAHALRRQFPDRAEMHVVHETIYLALYVQRRGGLQRELATRLRTGRSRRKPHRQAQRRQPRFADPMVMIDERPDEVEDRSVAGHWEGDLIIGKGSQSAIGTLIERSTRYVMLVHLPDNHSASALHSALTEVMSSLPAHLRRSLTWDQGSEMGMHKAFTAATGTPVYFCEPASPWQRGSNENANGLLRQYFPKGTDLAIHARADLNAVAAELNGRPRKALGWDTPAERLAALLEV